MKNKSKSDLWLFVFLILSLIICMIYIYTIDTPEIMMCSIHGGVVFDFIYQVSTGYIISYLFYFLIKSLFEKKDIQLKRELLQYTYRSTIKRLTECTTKIEMEYNFIYVVKQSGWNYHSSLFSAFEHNEKGLKALKQLYEAMKIAETDIKTYAKAINKPKLPYHTSLSHMAVDIYESEEFKKSFNDITIQLIPQIILCEPNYDIKQIVHKLVENIQDTKEIINGQKQMNTQETFPHLIRFVEHTIALYKILLEKEIVLKNSYHS